MSGRGGKGGGKGGGRGRVGGDLPIRRNPEDIRREEGLGRHWTMLRNEARTALALIYSEGDTEAQNAIQDHREDLRNFPRDEDEDDTELMVRLLAVFLDRIGPGRRAGTQGLDARDAIFWMTDARWDVEEAIRDILFAEARNRNPEAEPREGANVSGAKESSQKSEGKQSEPSQESAPSRSASNRSEEQEAASRANPDVDRAPAIKGEETPGKLTIKLVRSGKEKTLVFERYSKQGIEMDWKDPNHIRSLNRWRQQTFRRALGSTRRGHTYFHPEEVAWLIEVYRAVRREAIERGQEPNYSRMNWNDIVADFNHYFAGQVLSGDPRPRPVRSKASVMTERYRIPEICEMANLKQKGKQRARAPKKDGGGEEEEEEEEDDEEDDEEEQEEGDGDFDDDEEINRSQGKGKSRAKRPGPE